MRVLHVSTVLAGDGGIPTYLRGLLTGQAALGHQVRILTVPAAGSVELPGCEVVTTARSRRVAGRYEVPSGLIGLLRPLASWADVVHVHQPFAPMSLAASLVRPPKVLSPYLHEPLLEGVRRRTQFRAVTARFPRLLAVSSAEADLIGRYAGHRRPVSVCHPGAPDDLVRGRAALGEVPRVGFVSVSRLVPHKRVDRVLELYAALGSDEPLEVIGDGPCRPSLDRYARELGIERRVTFRGRVSRSELVDRLMRSRVSVSLSEEESYGISLFEGIAAGCVPIASDIPSHREILGGSGFGPEHLIPLTTPAAQVAPRLRPLLDRRLAPPATDLPSWADAASTVAEIYRAVC